MQISVFGSGYVGLVAAACFAEVGNHVVCMDVDEIKIANLKKGEIPIYEPGLAPLIRRGLKEGRIEFTTDHKRAVEHGLFLFIAVGTPADEDGAADLSHVLAVAKVIGQYTYDYKIIVNKSTVPVGTADRVRKVIQDTLEERHVDARFDVVSNPEFLKEGAAINDFRRPDRIVVGIDNDDIEPKIQALYSPFNRNHDRLFIMDVRSAELTKYAANALLATKISFMNDMANLAEKVGADIEKVRLGIGSDHRIGYHFIYAGCGYGGSCFPKDIRALINTSHRNDYDLTLVKAVETVNEQQKRRLFSKIKHYFQDQLSGKTIAIWGLAFKPNTDDMREAPARVLMEQLWQVGAKVQVYDPEAMNEAKRIYGQRKDLVYCEQPNDVLKGADALVVLTEWRVFSSPDFHKIKSTLRHPVIFDGRNLYNPRLMEQLGINYFGMGRGASGNYR